MQILTLPSCEWLCYCLQSSDVDSSQRAELLFVRFNLQSFVLFSGAGEFEKFEKQLRCALTK